MRIEGSASLKEPIILASVIGRHHSDWCCTDPGRTEMGSYTELPCRFFCCGARQREKVYAVHSDVHEGARPKSGERDVRPLHMPPCRLHA
jgi:hypothetical protein